MSGFKENMHDSLEHISDWDQKAQNDFDMAGLKQWDAQDIDALDGSRRPALVFDRLLPLVKSVSGSQVTNRYQSYFIPREYRIDDIDSHASRGASEWARYVQGIGDWEQSESSSFTDCLICGVGVLEMFMAYDEDPDGRIMLRRRPVWEVLWDPSSVEPNMKDGSYVIGEKWLRTDELASLFGKKHVDEVIDMAQASTEIPKRVGFWGGLGFGSTTKTTEQRYAYDLRRPRDWDDKVYDSRRQRIRLFDYQRFETVYQTRIIGPDIDEPEEAAMQFSLTGEIPLLDTFEDRGNAGGVVRDMQQKVNRVNELLSDLGGDAGKLPEIAQIEDFPTRYYFREWHTGAGMVKEEKMKIQSFTHLFLTCHEDWSEPGSRHFFGLVRQGKDPQKYSNKFLSAMIHLFTSNPKGAFVVEEGLFKNQQKLRDELNRGDTILTVPKGKLTSTQKEPFRQLTSNVNLRSLEGLIQFAQNAVPASVGISEAYGVGSAQDLKRTSGQAIEQVLGQGAQTQSAPFDSLRLYRKMAGRLMMGYTDLYADRDQVRMVVGDDDEVFLKILDDGDIQSEYNVVAEEAPTTANEKKEVFRVLYESGILSQLMSQGVPIPPEIAEIFPGPPETVAQLEAAFRSAYDVQMLNLEVQKLQLEAQLRNGGQPLPDPNAGPGGAASPPQPNAGGQPS